jgi:hypothetical protein
METVGRAKKSKMKFHSGGEAAKVLILFGWGHLRTIGKFKTPRTTFFLWMLNISGRECSFRYFHALPIW